jgi:hypothetical protein
MPHKYVWYIAHVQTCKFDNNNIYFIELKHTIQIAWDCDEMSDNITPQYLLCCGDCGDYIIILYK